MLEPQAVALTRLLLLTCTPGRGEAASQHERQDQRDGREPKYDIYQARMLSATEAQAARRIPVRVKRTRAESTSSTSIEIVLPKGSIHVKGGIDWRMLQHVIEALT